MPYSLVMKHIIIALAIALTAAPVAAQDAFSKDAEKGFSLLEEGAELVLRGLMADMEPALGDMAKALQEAEPMLRDLMAMMDELTQYHAPEMLPNGDILIRRKLAVEQDAPAIDL